MTLRPRIAIAALPLVLAACGAGDDRPADAADTASAPAAAASAEMAPADTACPPEPGDTVMRVRADGPEYRFRLFGRADAGTVDSVVVRRGCDRVQVLVPAESDVFALGDGSSPLSLADLDFDGYGDLALLVMQAMVNTTSEYWRYDPASGRFVSLGAFHTFQVDSARRELATYVRGGHAGLQWTSARYRFEGGMPVKVREEAQDWSEETQGYVRTVRELRGGALTETARDTLTADEAIRRAEEGS